MLYYNQYKKKIQSNMRSDPTSDLKSTRPPYGKFLEKEQKSIRTNLGPAQAARRRVGGGTMPPASQNGPAEQRIK